MKISVKFFRIFLKFVFKISTIITQNNYFFLIFVEFSWQFLSLLLTFYQIFCKFPNFFRRFTCIDKVTVEIFLNFYSGLLKNFLANFWSIFKFFFDSQIFLKKLSVISCLNMYLSFFNFVLRWLSDFLSLLRFSFLIHSCPSWTWYGNLVSVKKKKISN